MSSNLRAHGPLALLLLARLAVGLAYSLINPPWESYDEPGHFQYARYLAKHRTWLLRTDDPEAQVIWSKFQPPLYYLLIAPTLLGFDFGARFEYPATNPFLASGDAGVNHALNPETPTGLAATQVTALHIARAAGVVISTLSVLWVYALARRLWPREPSTAWTVTCLYAFWPQFVFIGSMVTNDLLVTGLAAALTYLAVRSLVDGLPLKLVALLGVVLLAGLLTKLNALAFVPVAAAALLFNRAYSWRLRAGLLIGAGVTTLIGVAALSSMAFVTGQVFQLETLDRFWRNFDVSTAPWGRWLDYGFRTFFASYGWGNVETFGWLYGVWAVGAVLGVIGLTYALAAPRRRPVERSTVLLTVPMLALFPLGVVGLSTALSTAANDPFLVVGRYLLPALPAVLVLLMIGWRALLPARWRPAAWRLISLSMIILSWLTPVIVLARVYAKPQPISEAEAAALDRSVTGRFGQAIELIGLRPAPAFAGERVETELCWRATSAMAQNYPLFLEVVGPDGQGYGRRQLYTGDGNYPTSLWRPGQPFCESYGVPVNSQYPAPAVGALRIQFLDQPNGTPLPITNASGAAVEDLRVPIVVRSRAAASRATHAVEYRLGEAVILRGYDVAFSADGRGLQLTLHWETRAALVDEYHVFAHLRTATPGLYTQSDHAPVNDRYPTTAWAVGERVLDTHTLALPEGTTREQVRLFVGMYRAADGVRLPVRDAAGQPVPNNEIVLPLP